MEDEVVDQVLNNVAENFCKKIDEAIRLLQVLPCLPRSTSECCPKLVSELKTGSDDERYVASQLGRLWTLETTCQKYNSKTQDVSTTMEQSARDIFKSCHKQTLDLVKFLEKDSCKDMRERLLNGIQKAGGSNDDENDDCVVKEIVDYLKRFKEAGSERISMSVKEKERNASQVCKLIERCKRLREERAALRSANKERSDALKKEKDILDSQFHQRQEELQRVQEKDECERKRREEEFSLEMKETKEVREKAISALRKELMLLEEELTTLKENNEHECNQSKQNLKDLEAKSMQYTLDHETHQFKVKEEVESILSKHKEEAQRRVDLERHFKLMERNRKIVEEEEALLQSVTALENKADAILFHGATQLQRLFRGLRDRALIRKKKKKSKKNGKGKGKGKSKSKKK